MINKITSFLKSKRGINTVEVVIILAVVVGLAIIFRDEIVNFAGKIMDSVFNEVDVDNIVPTGY